jgi:hypothetical protein
MVAYSKVVVIIMNTSMGYILEIKASWLTDRLDVGGRDKEKSRIATEFLALRIR